MAIQPIFVFSITRSGSTLLQRIIAAHDGVATASEPWLLLPYLYTMSREGVAAEYTHPLMVTAIEDFCRELPAANEDYPVRMRMRQRGIGGPNVLRELLEARSA